VFIGHAHQRHDLIGYSKTGRFVLSQLVPPALRTSPFKNIFVQNSSLVQFVCCERTVNFDVGGNGANMMDYNSLGGRFVDVFQLIWYTH